ncbi:6-phosphogluconolactonase (cycloisomerase 2 family) [Thermocatellispora tengchongensis]|uniref:6-phosphogluconolactonase (Cycloisomerase 2 family) n=1 Tax=Thermocatellispora tengchongensis TaxID=1073253 RepID=A0A840P8H6_9ACTN|nr:beta-propeller fold lactonase family protein [Thermocatellispora tengchongensis]MBB5132305.1 6-phosphogluconolactonase (cycloisomerase 2 family) [Thermocatellispora tengchongensis]
MRKRGRRTLVTLLAVVVAVAIAVASSLLTRAVGEDDAELGRAGLVMDEAPAQPTAPPAEGDGGQVATVENGVRPAGDADLREGAVFLQSNDPVANEVVAFAREADGTLSEVGRYATGGQGTGSFEDSAQGIVLGTADGEASPIQNIDQADLLFVTNAGSGTISVFRVLGGGLELVGQTPSGGKRPVSLTVNNGLLYVLNSGEEDRRLIVGPTTALENCGHGDAPSVTGFRVTPDGALQAIENSTRQLSGRGRSGCSQVSFTPDGRTLVVSERIASLPGQSRQNKGALVTFDVRYDGTLGRKQLNDPSGVGPFGFNFTRDGKLIVSEQNGALANPGGGNAAAYEINGDRTLRSINGSVANRQTDSCWVAITRDQRLVFVSSPFDGGIISSYRLGRDGALTLAQEVASAPDGKDRKNDRIPEGATDLSLSRDGGFLYQLNSFNGSLWVFKVNSNGLLTYVEQHQVFQLEPFGRGGEAAPFGIASF